MIWFIGDVHGWIGSYESITRRIRSQDPEAITIQLGDVGLGFKGVRMPQLDANDFFIHGNHDNSMICALSPHFLGEYGVKELKDMKVFYLSGAMSTDKAYRTEGDDWWEWEELTYQQLTAAVALYIETKPDLVVSHDCPTKMREVFGYREGGRTVAAMDQMFEAWKPKAWAFGHHHWQTQCMIDGTKFYCCGELQEKKFVLGADVPPCPCKPIKPFATGYQQPEFKNEVPNN